MPRHDGSQRSALMNGLTQGKEKIVGAVWDLPAKKAQPIWLNSTKIGNILQLLPSCIPYFLI